MKRDIPKDVFFRIGARGGTWTPTVAR